MNNDTSNSTLMGNDFYEANIPILKIQIQRIKYLKCLAIYFVAF